MSIKLRRRVAVSAAGMAALLGGCSTAVSAKTPCPAVLGRFTASGVPAIGPDELVSPVGSWADTIFTSRGDNGKGPHLVEVTPDNLLVRVLQDWIDLGPATAVQILDDPGIPENPEEMER